MPRYRIRASDGKDEQVWEETFASEARLYEELPKRGWSNVISVQPAPEPAPTPASAENPPPPIRADQIREEADWVYLAQELAEQHPLHGIGGWTGLLLALMILGAAIGLWALFQLGGLLAYGGLIVVLFLAVLAVQILNIVTIVLLINRSPAFPPTFIALSVISIVLTLILLALGDFSVGNIIGMISQILWLCYVLMSRRVNVTFRRRVEREDEWLKQGLAAGAPAMAGTS
jgi:hypothetical protein